MRALGYCTTHDQLGVHQQEEWCTNWQPHILDSVAELKWAVASDYVRLHVCTHEWDIYELRDGGPFELMFHGCEMGQRPTLTSAKSLAQLLQNVLDDAPSSSAPTPETES
jgi:hypothetical protein